MRSNRPSDEIRKRLDSLPTLPADPPPAQVVREWRDR